MLFFVAQALVGLQRQNRATVYIWDPSLSEKSAGHAALELREEGKSTAYYSLWPDRLMGIGNAAESVPGVVSRSYTEDIQKEHGREAEHKIVFYNVNFSHLRQKMERATTSPSRWTANGGGKKGDNCAIAVCDLLDSCLRDANQESLATSNEFFNLGSVRGEVTPSLLRRKLVAIKNQELRAHPETERFELEAMGERRDFR